MCSALAEWPDAEGIGWPSWALENHDAPRALSRWCAPQDRDAFARLKTLLLVSLRGNAIFYYGEELGLTQVDIPFDQLHDPEAIANWPLTLSRDGARTPMPWTDAPDAGFGSDAPWLPVGDDNRPRSVELQEGDPHSLLAFTRNAIALRKANPALHHGRVVACNHDGDFLEIVREAQGQRLYCRFNLGTTPVTTEHQDGAELIAIGGATATTLPPYSAIILETAP